MSKDKKQVGKPGSKKVAYIGFLVGLVVGAVLAGAAIISVMPAMMIVTEESTVSFDQTVEGLKKAIPEHGWVILGIRDMNKALAQHNVEFGPRVTLISLCQPEYAKSALTTDRYVSTIMPCTFSVWEGDDENVYLSRINMKVMARMFGGNIAKVMADTLANDQEQILAGLLRDK